MLLLALQVLMHIVMEAVSLAALRPYTQIHSYINVIPPAPMTTLAILPPALVFLYALMDTLEI